MSSDSLPSVLDTVFPKRWFPDHEPIYAEVQVVKRDWIRVGDFPDRSARLTYTVKDTRHEKLIVMKIEDGEVYMAEVKDEPE